MYCETQAEVARHAARTALSVPDAQHCTAYVAREPVADRHGVFLTCTYALHTPAERLLAKHAQLLIWLTCLAHVCPNHASV